MGQNIVEPEQRGLGPLAVSELAKEFRRLAAEAKERGLQVEGNYQLQRGKRLAFEQAAQMLEEKLNG